MNLLAIEMDDVTSFSQGDNMPGIPTKFVVADLVFDQIRKNGEPGAALLTDPDALKYAYLGSIGGSLGDFMAARPDIVAGTPNSPYFQVWLPILRMFAGKPAVGVTPATPGAYRNLKKLRETLDKAQDIIKRKAKFELIAIIADLQALPAVVDDLLFTVSSLKTVKSDIGKSIFLGGPQPKVAPSSSWQVRDTLHDSGTARFLRAVRELADTGDDHAKAYALGAGVGYATDLCGNPFVNSVVNAPYRNHWWRHRWIGNYIDTWVWGYYALGGAAKVTIPGVVPNPLYTNWPNLCSARLHDRMDLGLGVEAVLDAIRDSKPLPAVLPQPFVDFWKAAYTKAYGLPPPGSAVDDDGIQSAFVMTWLILWLQTSGDAIPCFPVDQVNFPDNCGARPSWVAVDGSVTTGGSTVSKPPPASADTSPSVAEVISGIALFLIGAAAYAGGAVLGGIAAIIGGALVADGETDPDWEKLRCDAGWNAVFLANMTNALHSLLKWNGLGFPYTHELAHDDIVFTSANIITPPDSALNTARSQVPLDTYPSTRWLAIGSDWANMPNGPLEAPVENAYPTQPSWPFHFVDGFEFTKQPAPPAPAVPPTQQNPLFSLPGRPPLVRDALEYAQRQANLNLRRSTGNFFGNAVDVSRELIFKTPPDQLLDWDLDGDPGIGYPTWLLPAPASPRSASIPEA